MADPLDLLSLSAAKAAINMAAASNEHDLTLARQITAVSRIVDDVCGPVVVRTVTAELADGGRSKVKVRRWPVTSFTTVREVRSAGTISTVNAVVWGATGDGYFAIPYRRDVTLKSGELIRVRSGSDYYWPAGSGSVEVTYQAGRYATTAAVDARFAEAAGAILRRMWKRESGIWSQASNVFELPLEAEPSSGFFRVVRPLVHELLRDEVQSMFQVA